MESLEGKTFGPVPLRVGVDKVADFVGITRDDPKRWTESAPPGWAAVCLFSVAPLLLNDSEVAGRGVIHGEQRFSWSAPIPSEGELSVTGAVTRVRTRGGIAFVGFDLRVAHENQPVLTGSSTFLVSGDAPAAGDNPEEDEPGPEERGENDLLISTGEFPELLRSASRADLVRYAAVSHDWNPIHWDHGAARAAGLSGVVVHGLLQAAWLMSAAATLRTSPAPLAEATFRFRAPLRPGMTATLTGTLEGSTVSARLVGGETELLTARLGLR
jgi:acyl dehydratase